MDVLKWPIMFTWNLCFRPSSLLTHIPLSFSRSACASPSWNRTGRLSALHTRCLYRFAFTVPFLHVNLSCSYSAEAIQLRVWRIQLLIFPLRLSYPPHFSSCFHSGWYVKDHGRPGDGKQGVEGAWARAHAYRPFRLSCPSQWRSWHTGGRPHCSDRGIGRWLGQGWVYI